MTRVVVDASVLLASLIADGLTRGLLLNSRELELYAPEVVTSEVQKHLPMVAARTWKSREIVEALLTDILARVEVVPTTVFASALPSARRRTAAAHAHHDEAYVALAEVLSAPIWAYDKDFRRVRGLRVLSISEVGRLIDRASKVLPGSEV
ncbi:MAG: hypothetical protein KGJ23_10075 [Euryarchaeota archaeon]|nr:hypothetical protein [Euryarchaeota archaeon]MDE1836951.1 hypothetical protein [Euryarchaeota archaeon]MDE1882059.1 hypothetical protein [Euryarchaeota archaeon]MDE2045864.1 hypothetical protein [Thermoplasmata archaeon]